jgi:hypothetical protein
MARRFTIPGLLMVVLALAPSLRADVKTKEKTLVKFEGMMGGLINRFAGAAAKEGITSTVAVKGNRLSRVSDLTGQIIDLGEEKVYDLDMKKKEYKVVTFEAMREKIKEERDKAAKQAKDMSAQDKQNMENAGKQLEFDAEVKETGEHKTIAGYETREVILTISAHEKGKKIEESGGFAMANDMWLGPKVAALDEIAAFELKYYRAVYGEALGIDPQQMATMMAMYPSFSKMAGQMQTEATKLQGTPLLTVTTFESVRSAEAMSAASNQQSSSGQQSQSGSGLGSFLARRLAPKSSGQDQPRSAIMTTTVERLSIETSASAEDVGVPAGFKEKK